MSLYIIDEHPMMRQAIAMLLRRIFTSTNVVEIGELGELAAATIKHGDPTFFVLDLLLSGVNGADTVKEIKGLYPNVLLAVFSSTPEGGAKESYISAGADVCIEKSTSVSTFSAVILGMLAEKGNKDITLSHKEIKLSKRQKQLIGMLDRGLSNRDIAAELEISEHTVKVHLWRLFRRLDVKSRTQVLHFARLNGML